jgi:hypothetical protein
MKPARVQPLMEFRNPADLKRKRRSAVDQTPFQPGKLLRNLPVMMGLMSRAALRGARPGNRTRIRRTHVRLLQSINAIVFFGNVRKAGVTSPRASAGSEKLTPHSLTR